MKRTTKYVALDVHQAMTVASVREERGRVIARTLSSSDPSSLPFVDPLRGVPTGAQ